MSAGPRGKAAVGDVVDAGVNDIGHVVGDIFDVVGAFAGEMLVDGLLEVMEPTFEAWPVHGGLADELEVNTEWIAAKAAGTEEDTLPKGVEPGQMLVPVHLSDVVKDGTDQLVGADFFVESIDEQFDLGAALDIG